MPSRFLELPSKHVCFLGCILGWRDGEVFLLGRQQTVKSAQLTACSSGAWDGFLWVSLSSSSATLVTDYFQIHKLIF